MVAIDLGSNTLRAVRLDPATLQRVGAFEKVVRSADGLHQSGEISKEAIARIIDALSEAKARLEFAPDEVRAVATAAFRIAKNGLEALEAIRAASGVAFTRIEADEEAYLSALGVVHTLRRLGLSEEFMLVDIGGGSTEVAFWSKERLLAKSLDVGIVTMAQKYGSKEAIAHAAIRELEPLKSFLDDAAPLGFRPHLMVATAGTPTTIAAMNLGLTHAMYDPDKINGTDVDVEILEAQLQRLLRMESKEREKWVGVGRADVIVAGVVIFRTLLQMTRFRRCTVIDEGLREGVAIAGLMDKKGSDTRIS